MSQQIKDDCSNIIAKYTLSPKEEEFHWCLNNQEMMVSSKLSHIKDHRSFESSKSMLSCIDLDDPENYSFAQDLSKEENESCEQIKLISLNTNLDLIKRNVKKTDESFTTVDNSQHDTNKESGSNTFEAISYTPERLIRCQEYRIVTPPTRWTICSQVTSTPETETPRKFRHSQRWLDCPMESEQINAGQLNILLNLPIPEIRTQAVSTPISENNQSTSDLTPIKWSKDRINQKHHMRNICEEIISGSRSSYNRLNSTWNDGKRPVTGRFSIEDTSSIQNSDLNLDMQNEMRDTPMSLSDELAIASRSTNSTNDKSPSVNEVASILEDLHTHPEKAAILLDEDRFSDCTSSHDQVTRLVLNIETDAEVPTVSDKQINNDLQNLREKIKRLQISNQDIRKDISNLRKSFQHDEQKVTHLLKDTIESRNNVRDMRFLDDLLKLLRGKVERITMKNWPFVVGRNKYQEVNLII